MMDKAEKILELSRGFGTSTSDGRTVVDPSLLLSNTKVQRYFEIAKANIPRANIARAISRAGLAASSTKESVSGIPDPKRTAEEPQLGETG
jgi:hypothetical protein